MRAATTTTTSPKTAMLDAQLDAPLDPSLDPAASQPSIYNTLPAPTPVAPAPTPQEPVIDQAPTAPTAPTSVSPSPIIPPIDQGPYAPPPVATDPTAPPPVTPPTASEPPQTAPTGAPPPEPDLSRFVAPKTSYDESGDPTFTPVSDGAPTPTTTYAQPAAPAAPPPAPKQITPDVTDVAPGTAVEQPPPSLPLVEQPIDVPLKQANPVDTTAKGLNDAPPPPPPPDPLPDPIEVPPPPPPPDPVVLPSALPNVHDLRDPNGNTGGAGSGITGTWSVPDALPETLPENSGGVGPPPPPPPPPDPIGTPIINTLNNPIETSLMEKSGVDATSKGYNDAPPRPDAPDIYVPPPPAEVDKTPVDNTATATPAPPDTSAEDAARMAKLKALTEQTYAPTPVPVPTTEVTPEQNLIAEQISPNDSARLNKDAALTDQANTDIATSDRNTAAASHASENIDPAVGERLARLRAMQDETLGKLANGPDRYQMAKDRFEQFSKDTAPEYDLNRKKALNDAANYGYTGAGRLVTQYGDLDLARERDLDSQRSRLLGTSLDQSIEDRKSLVNTLGNFANDEASYEQQTRDELRRERENRIRQGDADVSALYDKGNYLSGAEATQRGVEGGQRAEQRGERGYQRSLSEQALADQMDATKLNESLTQSEFERNQARANAGYAKDPSDTYKAAAENAYKQGAISQEELQQILSFIQMQKQGAGATAGG